MAWAEWLWQRGEQPGVVRLARARATAVRLTQFNTPPLSDEVARRYAAVMAMQAQLPPIVYAEPLPVMPDSVTAVPTPAAKQPLPIVTAQATAVPADLPPTILLDTPTTMSAKQSSTAVPTSIQPSTTAHTGSHTAVSPMPAPIELPKPLPVVRAIAQATHPAQPAKPPISHPAPTRRETAVTSSQTAVPIPPPAISMPERKDRERPSPNPITPVLPMVRVAASGLPTIAAPDLPQTKIPSPPIVTPVKMSSPAGNGASNGRAHTPLPLVQAQATAVNPPPATPLAQPMGGPAGGPMGSVIQRVAADTAVPRPAAKPAPNRVVQTNSVIQRVKGEGETAVTDTQADDGGETTDTQIDMDELVEKVHRRFLRKLAVEGERRGKTIWP